MFVCGAATSASTVTFHVNPSAAPGGDGSPSKPFATLEAARDGVRAARRAGKVASSKAVEIVLAPGDYVQTEGFVLEPPLRYARALAECNYADAPVDKQTGILV